MEPLSFVGSSSFICGFTNPNRPRSVAAVDGSPEEGKPDFVMTLSRSNSQVWNEGIPLRPRRGRQWVAKRAEPRHGCQP
jgi:hypothetical protein